MATNKRIAIIGGGAAGISAAYFLQKKGYSQVVVFEKADRVGGKCRTYIYEQKAYEEGAFTITRTYEEVQKLIDLLGFHLCNPPHRKVMEPGKKKFKQLQCVFANQYSRWRTFREALRYFREIYRYRNLGKPGFSNVDPELSQPFTEWAKKKGMEAIIPLFILPVSLFGYGDLHVIPAAYILKYIRFWNFLAILIVFLVGKLGTKRITEGYGQLWQQLVKDRINVRLNANLKRVDRSSSVKITFEDGKIEEFDELIIACPFHEAIRFLDLSPEEKELFSKVKTYDYFVTVFRGKGLPNNALYSVPVPEKGHAYMIYKPWKKNNLYVAYSFSEGGFSEDDILRILKEDLKVLGGTLLHIEERVHWKYFPHVSSEEIANGFYDKIEALQGTKHTYYTGGTLAFETVENVVRYSKALVEREF